MPSRLPRRLVAEAIGTFVLVLFGTGAVASAVFTGALVGLWQVAIIWAIGVAAGIALAGPISEPPDEISIAANRQEES